MERPGNRVQANHRIARFFSKPGVGQRSRPAKVLATGSAAGSHGTRLALVIALLTPFFMKTPAWAGSWRQDPAPHQYRSFAFSVIRIPVWVATRKGLPMSGLQLGDFQLLVDGKPASIESCLETHDRPLDLVYLLDLSGSMEIGAKLEGSIETISFLLKQHREGDRWRIVVFSDGQVVKIADESAPQLWPALIPKLRAYGKTAFYDALSAARDYFPGDSLENRAILLFTDGSDNQSVLSEDQLLKVLRILDVPVFIIGIAEGFLPREHDEEGNLALQTLQEITTITGGKLFIAREAGQLPTIRDTLMAALRPQYLLTMTVEQDPGHTRHKITVKIPKKPAYRVRYRRGYTGSLPEFSGGE